MIRMNSEHYERIELGFADYCKNSAIYANLIKGKKSTVFREERREERFNEVFSENHPLE